MALGRSKKKRFFWKTFPKSAYPPTHPGFFVRFGKTKGEIGVKKGDFWDDFVFLGRFGNQPPQPPIFKKVLKNNVFFGGSPMEV